MGSPSLAFCGRGILKLWRQNFVVCMMWIYAYGKEDGLNFKEILLKRRRRLDYKKEKN